MKKLILLTLILAGCVTTPEGKKRPDPTIMRGIVRLAAADTTAIYLTSHPEARPAFVRAYYASENLLMSGTGTTDQLEEILRGLPIREFKGPQGELLLSHAVFVYDAARKLTLGAPDTDRWKYFIEPVATGLNQGLALGLGL